jgi:6-phosphogluconolactonase (cycloisomerase 2 family)
MEATVINWSMPARANAPRPIRRAGRSRVIALLAVALGTLACDETTSSQMMGPTFGQGAGQTGAVFTSTNTAAGNEIVAFSRAADGTLVETGRVPTGGTGTGSGLGSQGAVTLARNGQWLLVVNAGSNDVSLFSVDGDRITLRDHEPTGGTQPVSVAVNNDLVYVLNAGSDDLAGFRIRNGNLTPVANGTRALAGTGTGAAQVAINQRGDLLVVTERAANRIETFDIHADGTLGNARQIASVVATPFGFEFAKNGAVIVSEANGGMMNGGAVSSYDVDGALSVISGGVANLQTAPCWVVVSNDARFAYAANAGSASISAYAVGPRGEITLLDAAAGTLSAGPLDMGMSRNGRFLYTVSPNAGKVAAFAVGNDGGLTPLGEVGSLPASSYGLAAM